MTTPLSNADYASDFGLVVGCVSGQCVFVSVGLGALGNEMGPYGQSWGPSRMNLSPPEWGGGPPMTGQQGRTGHSHMFCALVYICWFKLMV